MKVTDEMVDRLWDEIFDSETLTPPAPSTLRRGLEEAWRLRALNAEAKLAKVREWARRLGTLPTAFWAILDGD